MSKVKILVDSTSDIPENIRKRYSIDFVPLFIIFGEDSFRDGIDITVPEIFEMVDKRNMLPKTSAVNQVELFQTFQRLTADGSEVVFIGISSEISTTVQNALLVASEIPDNKVHVFDSRNLSIGIAIQAIKAAELAEQGKSAQEIKNFLNEISPKVRTSFIVKDLNYLKMGGRCSSLQAFAGSRLNIKPKIHLENGFVLAGENFRGSREKIVQKLIESSASDLPNIDMDTVLLAHAFASDRDVQIAKDCLLSLMPNIKNLIVTTTGGVISSHCGPETVGLVYKLK